LRTVRAVDKVAWKPSTVRAPVLLDMDPAWELPPEETIDTVKMEEVVIQVQKEDDVTTENTIGIDTGIGWKKLNEMEDKDRTPLNNSLGRIKDMILSGVLGTEITILIDIVISIGNEERKRAGEVEVGVGRMRGIEIITEVNDDTPS
jgi:hypothetical protein